MSDHPWDEVRLTFEEKIREGATVHQKYTCEACGSRRTMEIANVFYTHGLCEECGWKTDIRKSGCNYMVFWGI